MNITPVDITYLNKCEKKAIKHINYKNKISNDIKRIHNKIQHEYNMKTIELINELVRLNANILVSEELYPTILYMSTTDEFTWTTDKYILITCSPVICKNMFMKIEVYCFGNDYFNRYGINNMDTDVSFELDMTFAVKYMNENKIPYTIIESSIKSTLI